MECVHFRRSVLPLRSIILKIFPLGLTEEPRMFIITNTAHLQPRFEILTLSRQLTEVMIPSSSSSLPAQKRVVVLICFMKCLPIVRLPSSFIHPPPTWMRRSLALSRTQGASADIFTFQICKLSPLLPFHLDAQNLNLTLTKKLPRPVWHGIEEGRPCPPARHALRICAH